MNEKSGSQRFFHRYLQTFQEKGIEKGRQVVLKEINSPSSKRSDAQKDVRRREKRVRNRRPHVYPSPPFIRQADSASNEEFKNGGCRQREDQGSEIQSQLTFLTILDLLVRAGKYKERMNPHSLEGFLTIFKKELKTLKR